MGKNFISDEEDEEYEETGDPVDEDTAPGNKYDDEEDEEEEDGVDEYEKDDFIVDDVEEEDDGEEEEKAESDEERHKKKKKKKRREFDDVLDEDDYLLLRDNNAYHHRPQDSKKFKRLKKARRDEDEYLGRTDGEFDIGGEGSKTAEERLKRTLFGDDEGPFEDIPEEEEPIEEEVDVGDDDEMADFIVDEDYVDENGAPVRRKQVKGRKRQTAGVSSSAMQEARDLFGDVDELLLKRRQGIEYAEHEDRKLEHEFEPIILSEKYMTEKDDQIRLNDIPERIQISEESTGSPPADDESIKEETTWILKQLDSLSLPLLNFKDVYQFLHIHHVQKMDIPFIAMYRKEDCSGLLRSEGDDSSLLKWHKTLWFIHDLDKKWLLLQKRKLALNSYYCKRFEAESRRLDHQNRLNLNQLLFDSILRSLKFAETDREVDDVDMKFNLHFPLGNVVMDEGQFKRPKRKSLYSICGKSGLWDVAIKLGCSAEQLGNYLSLIKVEEELEDAKETPEEIASNFTCAMFESPQEVLKGARHMAAVEISCEPFVRKHVRTTYMDHAVVCTAPTADGRAAIEEFHQFAPVKWLRNKPIKKFHDAQWVLIQKAEEEKLLNVTLKLPEEKMSSLMNEMRSYYLSQGVSKSAQLWNEQRDLILQDALNGFLLPSLEKEARSYLSSKAKSWLLSEYGRALWDKVSVAPFKHRDADVSSDEESAPRVMACCWGPGKPATTFVMLGSSGEVLDVLYTGSLTFKSTDQQRKKNDQQRLLKFMMEHQPHVVVLGAANLACTKLKNDIFEIIFKMVEENPREVGNEMSDLNIVYGDESLPRIYENSRISAEQLPGQSGIVRRAAALGRCLQNSLAMVASLCGSSRDILSWKLHALENFLSPDEKYCVVEQIMVDVTNQVGLDLNHAASHEWLCSPLQFISGLGPRKASSLQRSLVRAGPIFMRKDLVTTHNLGKKVFLNAVGFLRIRRSGLASTSTQFIDLLDDTRIHIESYVLAQEMAKVVFETESGETHDDEEALEMAIEHVRDRPNLLKKLDLDDESPDSYLKMKKLENKKETLKDIRRELIHGFQDTRRPYKEPSQEEEFYMISGESEDTLSEGRVVQATVRRVQGPRAICALESGVTGILSKEDYADDWRDISDLSDRVHEGDILTCKIKSILKNRYQVFLVCRENVMRNNHALHREVDEYYHEDRSSVPVDNEKARREKEMRRKLFKPRMIVHPRFQNITADEAVEFLKEKEAGESIIRPSPRGPSYLTLTIKVYDGVFAHKDIAEGGKEHKDITSLLRLGKTLTIGDDTFEDLDEVMDRYVDPLIWNIRLMLGYRKFKKGSKGEVDEALRVEKTECPTRIVYAFGVSHEHPGTFILTFIRSTNPHHEYVGVYPKGFKFRKRMFEDIDRLVAYFQRHIDDGLNESAPSIRSVAAMVPMRTHEGGWRDRGANQNGRNSRNGSRDGPAGGWGAASKGDSGWDRQAVNSGGGW